MTLTFRVDGIPVQQGLPAAFVSKIEPSDDGCWNWTASLDIGGYGRFRIDRVECKAHRIAYIALVGPIPAGLVLDHLCRNRACVNPDHLEPVTNRENILRGTGWAARHAAVTHCPQGHEYSAENTWIDTVGRRKCRACLPEPTYKQGGESCRRGHLFTEENTKINRDGRRRCRACYLSARRAWRRAKA